MPASVRRIETFADTLRVHLFELGEDGRDAEVETARYGDILYISICPIIDGHWQAGPALLYRSDLGCWYWGTYGRVPAGEERWTAADIPGHASAEEIAHHFADNMR